MHSHDALQPHHDKDFRCLAAFPVRAFRRTTLRVWRVNHWGQLEIDTVLPPEPSQRECAVLIHRGHMRALHAPSRSAAGELLRHWERAGNSLKEFPIRWL